MIVTHEKIMIPPWEMKIVTKEAVGFFEGIHLLTWVVKS